MKRLIKYIVLYFAYIFLLCYCFDKYLTDVYAYYGFTNQMTTESALISILLLVFLFGFIVKQTTDSYSKLVIYVLILVNFIPSIITYMFMPISNKYIFLQTTYWLMMILFINIFNKIYLKTKEAKPKNNIIGIYIFALIEFFIVAIVLFKYTGFSLSFNNVYDLRNNYFNARVPLVFAYLFAAFKVVNPLLFIYLFNNKKKVAYTFSAIIQLMAFFADGSKSTLFSIIIAYAIVKFLKNKKDADLFKSGNIKYYVLYGLASINLLGFIEFNLLKSANIYNYFIRRLFFVPALLNQCYFDFFSSHPIDLFRQSFMGKIGFTSIYSTQIQKIISSSYFNTPEMLANNGMFSDAFMNLGTIGIFIMPIMICLLLRFLDYCSKGINPFYLLTIMVNVSYIFISSSFFTVLLTHGFILLCLILKFVIPRDKRE
ncbi:MAG TPA: oligosaccharide repeat unit polymerase [Clostridiaceae bacterium]|nr:oligosaccharide repeat unit polymerase [Clostridiaceae bacterium]